MELNLTRRQRRSVEIVEKVANVVFVAIVQPDANQIDLSRTQEAMHSMSRSSPSHILLCAVYCAFSCLRREWRALRDSLLENLPH